MLTAEPQSVKLEPMCGHDSSEGTSAIFPGNLSTGKPLPTELLPDCNPDFPSRRSGSSAFGANQMRIFCALLAGIFFFMVALHGGHDPQNARPDSAGQRLSNAVE
ncbi:hypothetical protein CYMTET_36643, partial [Cymbomonas tetramitiformis]